MNNSQYITPNLWIPATAEEVTEYYSEIFKDEVSFSIDQQLSNSPSGKTTILTMIIKDFRFRVMCTGPHEDFTDAVSFELPCEDQEEIDYYWSALTKDGEESMCGWCRDKFGVRWQIVPQNMQELMLTDDDFKIMLQQKKIVIADFNK